MFCKRYRKRVVKGIVLEDFEGFLLNIVMKDIFGWIGILL